MVYEKEKFFSEFEKMASAAELGCFAHRQQKNGVWHFQKFRCAGPSFQPYRHYRTPGGTGKAFHRQPFCGKGSRDTFGRGPFPGKYPAGCRQRRRISCTAIAAALPEVEVTALDSTAKKIAYVRDTADLCGMQNVHTLCTRAEEAGRGELREQFSLVTARAVARLPILLELCTPFVRVGGYFIAMKGSAAMEEEAQAREAAALLSCKLLRITPYSLPASEEKRFLLIYRKNSPTLPTYPRSAARITKKPLLPSFPAAPGKNSIGQQKQILISPLFFLYIFSGHAILYTEIIK